MELSSKRLLLSPLSIKDKNFFVSLFTDDDVMKYIGAAHDRRSAENKLQEFLQDCANGKRYLWLVRQKSTGKSIGLMGLSFDSEKWNLGAMFNKDMVGLGYGPEAMNLVITTGFEVLKIDIIYGIIRNEHVASQKAAKGVGFRYLSSLEEGALWIVRPDRETKYAE